MIICISPAKSLDFENAPPLSEVVEPRFIDEAEYLSKKLKTYSSRKIKNLMDISPALAELNHERYQQWARPFTPQGAKAAVQVFTGDVYVGLNVKELDAKAQDYLQEHLIILSGLYGALRPNDAILPYRLEMGAAMKVTPAKPNLYKFWANKIHDYVQERIDEQPNDVLINLASNEYFKSVKAKNLKARIITPEFKDWKNGEYKMLSFFAKKARGYMLRYIAENNINEAEDLKGFNSEGYAYNDNLSTEDKWVFTRDH